MATSPNLNNKAVGVLGVIPTSKPYAAVPQLLKDIPNWVCWKLELRNGELTKIPYHPVTGRNACADDPTTWGTFEQAVEVADILNGNDYQGIGFEFQGTNIAGIDGDGALTDVGDPYFLAILKILGSPYTEVSPSDTGLHAFVFCDALPAGKRKFTKGHQGIEIYHGQEKGRFFTVTGTHFSGDGIPRIADISLPYLLISQNQDMKFKALWLGHTAAYGDDHSKADFALLCHLAKLTQNDPVKMERYFSASALGQRDKWTVRDDYRPRSIKAAIAANPVRGKSRLVSLEFHSDPRANPKNDYVMAPADRQKDGWFPCGAISLIGGASGACKTTWIFDMLYKQKQGWEVLGHTTFKRLFHVLTYDRDSNSSERTLDRMEMLPSDIPTTALPLAFGVAAVQNIINEIEKMDPTPSIVFLDGLDMLLDDTNKKSVVSPFMRQLQEVAAHFHISLIGSVGAPKSKQGEGYAAKRDKLSGSEAWGRNCETVCVMEFAEDDDGTTPRRLLTVLPRNAPAEKFTMEFQGGRLVLVQPTEAEEKPILGRPNTALHAAIQFLEQELQDGPRESKELVQQAYDQENISRPTLFRAAKELKLSRKDKGRVWELGRMHEMMDKMDIHDMSDMKTGSLGK